MTAPSYKYCAARALDLWVRREKQLSEGLQDPGGEEVRKSLTYYKVARGFAGLAENGVADKLAKLLREHPATKSPKEAANSVQELARRLQNAAESEKGVLSAASKLLWLRHKAPYVIYDGQAVAGLKKLDDSVRSGDYAAYYDSWRTAFKKHKAEINRAVESLPEAKEFTAAYDWDRAVVEKLVKKPWFAERTFDQYLWLEGLPQSARQ